MSQVTSSGNVRCMASLLVWAVYTVSWPRLMVTDTRSGNGGASHTGVMEALSAHEAS